MADRIQLRRDIKANWEKNNPILLEGEEGFVLDNPNLYKLGDGIHNWNNLPYRGYNGTIAQDLGNDENSVISQKAITDLFNLGYIFINIATTETIPIEPNGKKIYYLAFEDGIYTGFGTTVRKGELTIFYSIDYGGGWNKMIIGRIESFNDALLINRIASKAKSKLYELEEIESQLLRGGFVRNASTQIEKASDESPYGLSYIPVKRGRTYLFASKTTEYQEYAVLSFSKEIPASGNYVDYIILSVDETKEYDLSEAFTAIEDGYLLFGTWNISGTKIYELGKEKSDIISKSELESNNNTKSVNYCNYWDVDDSIDFSVINNTTTDNECFTEKKHVTKLSDFKLSTYCYIYGTFNSDEDWLSNLKKYQTEDGQASELILSARVYNGGESSVQFRLSTRYKEGGEWITPYTDYTVEPKSYKDVELKFTPNYNGLTTIIDLYSRVYATANSTIEIGDTQLYIIDSKKREPIGFIAASNIKKGINYNQLSEELQKKVDKQEEYVTPPTKMNIVCSGSSITWGDGRIDGVFVGEVDKFIKEKLSNTILSEGLNYSSTPTIVNNSLLYGGKGHKISGVGNKINFSLYGDEIAICQAKLRSDSDYGIISVKADGVLIGKFDNKNYIKHESETFSGEALKKVQLKHPCTFNHTITINNSQVLSNVQYNTGGYGGTIPSDCDAFVFRGLDDDGNPVHCIQFSDALGTITSVSVDYDYGRIIAHERSTVGQTDSSLENESVYGSGSTAFDPAHPTSGLSSGLEFRAIDQRAFFIHKFSESKLRNYELEIVGGNNPYLVINYVTNRYHNLMNAGIGGWSVDNLINGDKVNDYTQMLKWFQPDIIFQESSTNDDWSYPIRRISRSIGEITKEELVKLKGLEVTKVAYQSESDKYSVEMATGLIKSITATSLTSDDVKGTSTQVGDIVRIGNYYGDNRAVVCRKISEVDNLTGTIKWIEPIIAENILGIEDLQDLVGAEINIRDLSGYESQYGKLIEKIREVSPQSKIVIVSSGLSIYWLRQLWGYDIVHRDLCNKYHNVYYCDVTDWLYDAMNYGITGNKTETISSTGASSYELTMVGNRNSWQGFQVLVDGIDVYGKDCRIESGYYYHADQNKTGSQLNKNGVYDNRGVDNQTIPMKLVFTKNIPESGKNIIINYADNTWSSDYCHTNTYGAFIYGQKYCDFIKK